MKTDKKILIFKIGAIGDVIMTTPFLRQLRKNYPNAQIDYLIGNTTSQILENNPNINEIIRFDEKIFFQKKIFKWKKLINDIKKKKYDTIFVLDKHWIFNLTAKLIGIKERIGFDRLGKEGRFLTKKVHFDGKKHEINYYLKLLEAAGKKPDYKDLKTETFLTNNKDTEKENYVAIINSGGNNPGEKTKIRMIPDKLFIELINEISKKHKTILLGGKEDKKYYNKFKFNQNVKNEAGQNLKQSLEIMKKAKNIITTDCGAMHMAGTVNDNIICIFGPTNPKRKAPLNKGTISIWKDQEQYDKNYENHGKTPKPKKYMTKITIKDIIKHIS